MALLGYARVSTQSQNLDAQLDALRRAGVADSNIFQEKVSGAARVLPELEVCKRALREGDTLVVQRLDRLGRRMGELISLIEDLEQRGVTLQTIDPPMRTDGEIGKLILSILAWLAESERKVLIERTKAGLDAARERGRLGGRKKKLTPTQEQRVVRQYFSSIKRDEHGDRLTVGQIAAMNGISQSMVYRLVRNHKTAEALKNASPEGEQHERDTQ